MNEEIPKSTMADHSIVTRGPIKFEDGYLNISTRWYIFIWVSVFVVFLTFIFILYSYQAWIKHKIQTRDLENGLEMASPMYIPTEQMAHLDSTCPNIRQTPPHSPLYMELGDPPDGASETRNRNHAFCKHLFWPGTTSA